MDYEKKSSGVAKAGLATGITGTALGVLDIIKDQWGCKDGRKGGGYGGYPAGGYAPGYGAPYAAPYAAPGCGCYVTEKEMCLIRENSDKGDVIARQAAELFTERSIACAVKEQTEINTATNNRICRLETAEAVNAARDCDFHKYVEREFIHQPKAGIRESLVVCHQCGCECDDSGRRGFNDRDDRGRRRDRDCDCGCNGDY